MGIKRVRTGAEDLPVFDLRAYEFDRGFMGFVERLYLMAKHSVLRFIKFFRFFLTTFLGVHYVYIISWIFVLSWILYPQRNITYTDALFQAASAITLTGLNSVSVNDLKLYQQVFLFVVPLLTNQLAVASFMVYYRLWMYRRKFHDIEVTSKQQSKLRRANTFSIYDSQMQKNDPGRRRFNLRVPQLQRTFSILPFNQHQQSPPPVGYSREMTSSSSPEKGPNAEERLVNDEVGEAFHEKPETDKHGINEHEANEHEANEHEANEYRIEHGTEMDGKEPDTSKIRFGDLPHPKHDDHAKGHSAHNVFRSLAYMREHMQDTNDDDDEDGPPLVIKSPRDIERDERRGIHSAVEEQEDSKIRFGSLPKPPQSANLDDEEGPPLVIKSPRDVEADERRGIHSSVAGPAREGDQDPADGEAESLRSYSGNVGRFSDASAAARDRFRAFSHLPNRRMSRIDTVMSEASARRPREMRANYLSYAPTLGRNSAFIGLTADQKEELGGVEYRALKVLRWITAGYIVAVLCFGFLVITPWVYERHTYTEIIRAAGVSPVTFAMTTVLSSFNNNGFCTLPESLVPFWHTAYLPLFVSFVIFSGNVGLPILMRLGVFVVFKLSPPFGQTRETLGFLLDHPRRCFMLMFPLVTTVWLAVALCLFLVVEVAFFMILNCGTHSPEPDMAAGPRLLSAYFQSITMRTAGFTMIDVAAQHPAMLVLNIIAMYIGIYPIAMSIRKSNVYEEQTLGRYYREPTSKDDMSVKSLTSNAIADSSDDEEDARAAQHRPNLRRRFSNFSARILGQDEDLDTRDLEKQDELKEQEAEDEDDEDNESYSTLVDHMRRQLSMDVWSLVLGMFLTTITEGGAISRGEFSLFSILYEVVSAHGTVGLSMGLSGTSLALSGGFSNLGKLILIAVMIRGRHRGMPYSVDRAVILHGKDLHRRDIEQETRVRSAKRLVPRDPSQTQTSGSFLRRAASFSTLRNSRTRTQRSEEA